MVTIFIEGEPPQMQPATPNPMQNLGGLFETQNQNLQEAFTRLFEQIGFNRQIHTVVMSGGTTTTMKMFAKEVVNNANVLLLIDTDDQTKNDKLEILKDKIAIKILSFKILKDKILIAILAKNKKENASIVIDDIDYKSRSFFMVQEQEAWFLNEKVIERWFHNPKNNRNVTQKQGENIAENLKIVIGNSHPSDVNEPDKQLDKVLKMSFETTRNDKKIDKGYKSKVADGSYFLLACKIDELKTQFVDVENLVAKLKNI